MTHSPHAPHAGRTARLPGDQPDQCVDRFISGARPPASPRALVRPLRRRPVQQRLALHLSLRSRPPRHVTLRDDRGPDERQVRAPGRPYPWWGGRRGSCGPGRSHVQVKVDRTYSSAPPGSSIGTWFTRPKPPQRQRTTRSASRCTRSNTSESPVMSADSAPAEPRTRGLRKHRALLRVSAGRACSGRQTARIPPAATSVRLRRDGAAPLTAGGSPVQPRRSAVRASGPLSTRRRRGRPHPRSSTGS
jgi:hypothetical protein